MRKLRCAPLLVLAACGTKSAAPASSEVTGALTIGGEPVVVTRCRPDHGVTTYVVMETARGAVRFEDKRLYWNPSDPEGVTGGHPLDCAKLDRSWGGGVRADGTAYWRGTLSFDCSDQQTPQPTKLTGELTLDCGAITPEERAQLDQHRNELREQQQR